MNKNCEIKNTENLTFGSDAEKPAVVQNSCRRNPEELWLDSSVLGPYQALLSSQLSP